MTEKVSENKINKKEDLNSDSKSVNDNTVAIDIGEAQESIEQAEQSRELNDNSLKKKKKVNIFRQLLLKRVYITAIVAYVLYLIMNFLYSIIYQNLYMIFDDDDTSSIATDDSSNQEFIVEEFKKNQSFYYIFTLICFGPILEEIIFRFCIFRPIQLLGKKVRKNNKFLGWVIIILAFIISSSIFAFGHFSFSFSLLFEEFESFPAYFLMGIVFAGAYHYDGYFVAAILTHMLNNSIALIIIYFQYIY